MTALRRAASPAQELELFGAAISGKGLGLFHVLYFKEEKDAVRVRGAAEDMKELKPRRLPPYPGLVVEYVLPPAQGRDAISAK